VVRPTRMTHFGPVCSLDKKRKLRGLLRTMLCAERGSDFRSACPTSPHVRQHSASSESCTMKPQHTRSSSKSCSRPESLLCCQPSRVLLRARQASRAREVRGARGSPLMSSRSRVSTWSSSREFSQEQGEDFPPREDSEESSVPLAGLRRAFVRSGLTVRTPEALAELMRHDVAEVVGALLEDAWRLRRHCRARHTAALEATQQARLAAEGARCERLMRENARLLGELAESDERRQALNSDRNRYAASVALRLRADPSLAARQEGTSKLSLEWVDEQAEAAAGSRELVASSPEKSSSSVAAMPASLKHGAGPAPGVTWSPPGAAAPSHHKAHTSNEGESGAFTTAARTAAFTTSTRTNPTLTPWWKNRSATRQTTSAKEDERFDSYSIYHPGQGGAPMANRCRASPGLAAIAYTPWRSAAALSGSSNRR